MDDHHMNLRPLPWILGEGFRMAADPVAVRLRIRVTLALATALVLLAAAGAMVGVTEAPPRGGPVAERPPASVEVLAGEPVPRLTTAGAR